MLVLTILGKLYFFVGLFILVSTSFVVANQVIPVQQFSDCENDTLIIQVSTMQPLYVEEYDLPACTLVDETENRWECVCEDSLNVSLVNFFPRDQTFIFQITSLSALTSDTTDASFAGEDIELTDDALLDASTDLSATQLLTQPTSATLIVSSQNTRGLFTGAVTGGAPRVTPFWMVLFFLALLLAISVHVRFVDWPFFSTKKRARRLHKRARKAFVDGEHKLAEKYYAKAAKLRK
jgi:hypothetical protein